jgi:hypothetical protein
LLELVPTNERRRNLVVAALVVLAFPSLAFNGSAAADYAGPIHSDEQLRRLTDYQGPVRSDGILRAWREQFLGQRFNRAIAITEIGGWGTVWGRKTPEDAMDDALRNCRDVRRPENLIHECHLYAVNNAVVYPRREYELPKLKVDFGNFSLREDYFFYGPRRSKGVIVWSHGTSRDKCLEARHPAAWSFITRFNLDGWDVLRFDRDQCPDLLPRALSQMAASIPQLHDAGYRQIVLAGQSRGAWQSLQILLAPGVARLVSAVIGVAPARHGTNPAAAEQGWADWISLIDHLDAPQVAIALVFFPKDEYTPDAFKRAAYAATALAKKGNPSMIVYEEEGVIAGHSGGGNRQFTDKFSPCLIQFLNSSGRDRVCGTAGLAARG